MQPFRIFQSPREGQLILGRTGKYRFFPTFTIDHDVRKFHAYVVGLTGRGKSKLLQSCIVQDIQSGRGCAVIDPHGDLVKDVLRDLISKGYFSHDSVYDRFLYLSPRRRDYIVPYNVLKRHDENTETYELVQQVISAEFLVPWPALINGSLNDWLG